MNEYDSFCFDWKEEDYGQLEQGVRELVRALHRFRIRTIWSCEGHIRTDRIYSGILPYPWIMVILNPSDRRKIQARLGEWNRKNQTEKWILSRERVHPSFSPDYIRRDVTCGDDTLTVMALVPEDDNESRLSATALAAFQQQVPKLASFFSA